MENKTNNIDFYENFINSFQMRAGIELSVIQKWLLAKEMESAVNQALSNHWSRTQDAYYDTKKEFQVPH